MRLTASIALLALASAGSLGSSALAEPSSNLTVVTPERRGGLLFETPAQVFVLDGDALDDAIAADVPDLLHGLPGVMLQRTNRGAGAPVLRGLIGPENLLLLDGVRLNTSIYRTGPNQYAALIDPRGLDAVELVLGPGSVLYGTDAMGGTINHLTRAVPRRGSALEASIDGASVDLGLGLSLLGEIASGPLSGWARIGYRGHGDLRTGGGSTVPLSTFSQLDWATRIRLALGRDWALTSALVGTALTDAGRIDSLGKGDIRLYDNLDNVAYVRVERRPGSVLRAFSSTLSLHAVTDGERRRRCNALESGAVADRQGCIDDRDDAMKAREHREDDVLALAFSNEARIAPLAWLDANAGLDLRNEWIGSVRKDAPDKRGNFSDGSTFGSADGWLWLEARPLWSPFAAARFLPDGRIRRDEALRLKFGGGLRATTIFTHAPDVPGIGDVDHDFSGLVGSARASLLVGRSVHLWTGFSQGFRAPNLQETTVLGDTGSTFEVPNADLRPQRNETFDVGLRMTSDVLEFSAVGFVTAVTDAIVREPSTFDGQTQVDGKDVFRRTNASRVDYTGLELTLGLGPFRGLSLNTSLSIIDGTLTEQDGDQTAPRRLPPLQGRITLRWQSTFRRLRVEAGLIASKAQHQLAADDLKDLRICGNADGSGVLETCPGTDGWATFDLGAAMDVTDDLEARLRVENLLDAEYRIHGSGFDAPGLGAEAGLTYRFK